MKRYATINFEWRGLKVELRPNKHTPRLYLDLYINGERKGICEAREARRIAKTLCK